MYRRDVVSAFSRTLGTTQKSNAIREIRVHSRSDFIARHQEAIARARDVAGLDCHREPKSGVPHDGQQLRVEISVRIREEWHATAEHFLQGNFVRGDLDQPRFTWLRRQRKMVDGVRADTVTRA